MLKPIYLVGIVVTVTIIALLSWWLKVNPIDVAQCALNGGSYKNTVAPLGAPIQWQCVYEYNDAGKKCTSSTECEGDCLMTNDTKFKSTGPLQKEYVSGYGVCEASNEWTGCTAGTIENPTVLCE